MENSRFLTKEMILEIIPGSYDEHLLENITDSCGELTKYLNQRFRLQNMVESLILTEFLLDEYKQLIEGNPLLQKEIRRQVNYIRDRLATTNLVEENPPDETN